MDEPVLELVRVRQAVNRVTGMPFRWSLNPYRGCAHACIYCYARPTHEYAGFSDPARFERHILVKENVAEVLRRQLAGRGGPREEVAIGTATDPYQPAEARFRLTRAVLEVLRDLRVPASVTTKSPLVVRDADLLADLGRTASCTVLVSVGTLDEEIWRIAEPRAPHPRRRIEALAALRAAGVRAGVLMAPVFPGWGDRPRQLEDVVAAAAAAGAQFVHPIPLRLPPGVREWCLGQLARQRPALARAYGRRYPPGGGYAPAAYTRRLEQAVRELCRRYGIPDGEAREDPAAPTREAPPGRQGSVPGLGARAAW